MENFIQNVLPFLTSLAALLTAYASLRAVKEMKIQRASSYMPEPMFTKTYFYTYWGNPKKGLPIYWSPDTLDKPPFKVDEYRSSRSYFDVQFECFNVGMGVAKNVEILWSFELEKFIEVLKKLDKQEIFRITIGEDGFVTIFSKKLDYLTTLRIEEKTLLEFKFILPFGVSDTLTLARVPTSYTELYSIFLYLFIDESTDKSSVGIDEIPSLKGVITYNDIENDKYKASFSAKFQFSSLFGKTDEQDWSKATRIEVDFKENT